MTFQRQESIERVPVFRGPRIAELVLEGSQRYRALKAAPNVEKVRRRKDRRIVQFNLEDHGADKPLEHPKGNPRNYSHDHENKANPPRVWMLRYLPAETRSIYQLSVTDCLK